MKTSLLLLWTIFSLSVWSQEVSTVEIKPNRPLQTQPEDASTKTNPTSYYQSAYKSNWEMRNHRKLGAGVGLVGIFGQIGGVADINFDAQNAAQVGFGSGTGYNTFFMGWKNSFESKFLSPYTTLGYSRWYSSGDKDLRGNSFVLDQVLSDNELSKGKIGVDFFLGNVGVQYNQLNSEWIGNTFFLEFNFLYSIGRGVILPAASVGSVYYF